MRKLGVVVFGASVYDYHSQLNNSRFASSAKEFRKVTADTETFADFQTETLDLYNKSMSLGETLDKIIDFVSKEYDDIIIFYCGHGDVGLRDGDYRVFLRGSNRERRHTLLNIVSLINDIKRLAEKKRVYFILDACYSGSAVSEMETMDVGGAEALINRRLSEAVVDNGSGTAVLAASGRFGVALARQEDRLTLFTGAFIRCLREGIAHRNDIRFFSWLDLKDEIIRGTRDRLGPDAPIPRLTSFSESASDITRTPFFYNRAFVQRIDDPSNTWIPLDDRVSEHLYWKGISKETPGYVLEDFLAKFPKGTFAAPARALLMEQIARFDETGLVTHLRTHPNSPVKTHVEERLLALQRDRIQKGADVTELEQIVAAKPESELAAEARLRIDVIRRERAEREAWERIKTSAVPEEFRQFLVLYPDSQFSELARASLADLSATSDNKTSWPAGLLGSLSARVPSFKENWRHYAAAAALLALGAAGTLLMAGGNSTVNVQSFRKDFVAAGDDPVKLRAFISQCAAMSCPFEREARDRLNEAEQAVRRTQIVEAALDSAGIDLAQLRKFVQQCDATSCVVAQEARNRLAKAEETARRTQIVEAALDAAGVDLGQLRKFVQQCNATSCAVAREARDRLAKAEEAEAARLARIAETDRKALDAAGTDLGQLRKFVEQCNSACTMAPEARNRLARAETAETARLARIAEADRKALDAAGVDLGQLRKFVQQCNATSCTVAQEAHDRLAKAETVETARARAEAERIDLDAAGSDVARLRSFVDRCRATSCSMLQEAGSRLARAQATEAAAARVPLKFNTFRNYDINQNDIGITFDISYADCNSKCQSTSGCIAFVFNKWKNACFLKSQVGPLLQDPRSDSVIRTDQPWPVVATTKVETCPYHDSSMTGEVTRSSSSQSAATCRKECEANQGCVAYTYRKADRRCSFFSSVSDRTRDDPTSDSGSRMQNPC